MLKVTTVTPADLDEIRAWLATDSWHNTNLNNKAEFMLSANGGLLSFCVKDDQGSVFYIRLDKDFRGSDLVRVTAQFAPVDVVSKRRVVIGLKKAFLPVSIKFAKDKGYKGLIFESVNPSLIAFMDRLDFEPAENDDYALRFKEQQCAI